MKETLFVLASIATIATFLQGLLREKSSIVMLSTEVSSHRPFYDQPEKAIIPSSPQKKQKKSPTLAKAASEPENIKETKRQENQLIINRTLRGLRTGVYE